MTDSTKRQKTPTHRVLHLVHHMNMGGIETWLLSMLQKVPRADYAMDICYKGPTEGELAEDARRAGAKLLHCPLNPMVIPFIGRLKKVLRDGGYSLLHVHTQAHSGPAVAAAKSLGIPCITTFYNTAQPAQTRLTRFPIIRELRSIYAVWSMRYAVTHSTHANGVSKGVADAVTDTTRLGDGECGVFHTGAERPPAASPEELNEARLELNVPKKSKLLIHVGSFHPQKNHDGILRAFKLIALKQEHATLLLVGDGPLRKKMEQLACNLGIENRVRFLGKRRDVGVLLQLADLYFFPSHHEGFSIALLEACAAGLPIVASDIPGNREATQSGAAARLFDASETEAIADACINLLRDSAESKRLGDKARKIFDQSFSIEASAQRLKSLYNSALLSQESQDSSIKCNNPQPALRSA